MLGLFFKFSFSIFKKSTDDTDKEDKRSYNWGTGTVNATISNARSFIVNYAFSISCLDSY